LPILDLFSVGSAKRAFVDFFIAEEDLEDEASSFSSSLNIYSTIFNAAVLKIPVEPSANSNGSLSGSEYEEDNLKWQRWRDDRRAHSLRGLFQVIWLGMIIVTVGCERAELDSIRLIYS
jgi:hypothetical protein